VAAYRKLLAEKVSSLTVNQSLARLDLEGRQLYNAIFKPLETELASSRKLIIVPDGTLAYLPFEALPVASEGGRMTAAARYLLERFSVSYAPSATALAAIKANRKERASQAKSLIAFGDPVYDPRQSEEDKSAALNLPSRDERGFSFKRLPHTRTEVNDIASLFRKSAQQIYLGQEAREQNVKQAILAQYRYVHFAAHGLIDEQRPQRSGIVLSTGGDEKEDGVLQMSEVVRLKLNADLVTLSACSTGLGKLINGEGIIGLTRSFFYAGASSVVISLWNVNDLATAELMKAFYQNLNRGAAKDEALRQAKLALMKSPNRAWKHPYFWASFVLMGERQSQ
jgi:CHAT domain-containing protein